MIETLDTLSGLVTVKTGFSFRALEKALNKKGYTSGYFSAPANEVTVQEALEKNLPNRDEKRYGSLWHLCTAVAVLTAQEGVRYETKRSPASAAGPLFKNIFIGSHGQWGRIVEATLKVFPR
ncbi:MAG: FAD-binding oxidoreductase [Deltaproteobacteria bacterium]|nr:FAD-binding oxidoreductase [Deltaproteobacteria bacterium]